MEVKIIRSKRRKKTASARLVDGVLEVRVPTTLSAAEEAAIVKKLQARAAKRQLKAQLDDAVLEQIARRLNRRYFDRKLRWESIGWVTNQEKRFGSCTPSRGTIRISHRLARMPRFVQEYVVMHELAHLREANHSARFWELVYAYPKTERARGYLMAVGLESVDEGE